jgi:hypothetical protein
MTHVLVAADACVTLHRAVAREVCWPKGLIRSVARHLRHGA